MNTLNFNDMDLKANRKGHLSVEQMEQLEVEAESMRRHNKFMLSVGIGVSILLGVSIAIAMSSDPSILSENGLGFILIGVGYILLFALIVFGNSWKLRRFTNMPIRSVEGTVQVLRPTDGMGMPVFLNRLIVRNNMNPLLTLEFDFRNTTALDYFEAGGVYRVYYLDKRHVLSAEEIELEKTKR